MFIDLAYAEDVTTSLGVGQDVLMNLLPFVLIFIVMYFLIIRPQSLSIKKRKEMLSAINRGDTVITGGGIIAKVIKVLPHDELELDVGHGVKIFVLRGTIADVRTFNDAALDSHKS